MAEKIKIAVRLDREDCRWLEARATAESKTASAIIREAISTARSQEMVLARLDKIEAEQAAVLEKIDKLGRLNSEAARQILAKFDEWGGGQ